jgi:hypothetical protein
VSLLFFGHQGDDLLRAKGVVILDKGHLLTSHPTDMRTVYVDIKFTLDKSSVCPLAKIKRHGIKIKCHIYKNFEQRNTLI